MAIPTLLIANTVFWLLFWGYFMWLSEATPNLLSTQPGRVYHSHPNYVSVFGRGLQDGFPEPIKKVTLVQLPSLLLAVALAYVLPGELLFAGTNPPGFRLLATMFISYVQWYLLGSLISLLLARFRARGSTI